MFCNEWIGFYTYAKFSFLARQDFLARAKWPFFASGFLPRHLSLFLNRLISPGRKFSPWRALILKNMVPGTPFTLWRDGLCTSFWFSFLDSCFVHSIPAQLGKVRYRKYKIAFCHLFIDFPWITCKTSNQKCLI